MSLSLNVDVENLLNVPDLRYVPRFLHRRHVHFDEFADVLHLGKLHSGLQCLGSSFFTHMLMCWIS